MLVGTAVRDGNTIQAVVAGNVSNVNDQSVAHFAAESDEVLIDVPFGTTKIGVVHEDRAIVTCRVADGLESTSFDKGSVSFDLKGWGTNEAIGNK